MIEYVIGIDPGKNTGVAILNLRTGRFEEISTLLIHNALELVDGYLSNSFIIVEDAHKSGGSRVKAQGAGSIKRDCTIWKDYLEDNEAFFKMQKPKNTKLPVKLFKITTGWDQRTSQHARDAAMSVVGYSFEYVNQLFKQINNTQ